MRVAAFEHTQQTAMCILSADRGLRMHSPLLLLLLCVLQAASCSAA